MNDAVDCPVCDGTTDRGEFPTHLATDHLDGDLRSRFAYSTAWAWLLPAVAFVCAVVSFIFLTYGLPVEVAAVEAAVLVGNHRVGSWLGANALLGVILSNVVLGVFTVVLARGPGQEIRRGWTPHRIEYFGVGSWGVLVVGPTMYAIGGTRRALSVRFAREKTVIGTVTARERFAEASDALADDRHGDAAVAFEAAGDKLRRVHTDTAFVHPALERHLAALERACGMATRICEGTEDGETVSVKVTADGIRE